MVLKSSQIPPTAHDTSLKCRKKWIRANVNKNKKFWEELITYSPLIRHGQHTKRKTEGGYRDRQQGDLINLLLFFQNKETRLIKTCQYKIMHILPQSKKTNS
jgi:hypothetical protein